MLEWIPVINSLVKAVGKTRREKAAIAKDFNSVSERRLERHARLQIARLRFNAPGMKSIVEKINEGNSSAKDIQDLHIKLDETLDYVTLTLNMLSFEKEIGDFILEKKYFSSR
jgi:hypothetical protein